MTDEEARAALQRLIEDKGEDYSGLSRLLGRNAAYVQQYIKRGSPRRLAEADRRLLARYFGVDETALGGPAAVPAGKADWSPCRVSMSVRRRARAHSAATNAPVPTSPSIPAGCGASRSGDA